MAGSCFSFTKMKRKDLDDVYGDFSDFSLSSPARKIRRLDADLPPIMEEEDSEGVAAVDQVAAAEEKEPMVDENLERALVVFKRVNNHPFMTLSPCDFTVSVDSDVISGIKNQNLWSSCTGNTKSNREETTNSSRNMAVVPWVPSQHHIAQGTDPSATAAPELMEADIYGESAMEIEDHVAETQQQKPESDLVGMRLNEGFHHWQQQHCLIPQLPLNTSTPISWSR